MSSIDDKLNEVLNITPEVIEAVQYLVDLSEKHKVMRPGTLEWGGTPKAFFAGQTDHRVDNEEGTCPMPSFLIERRSVHEVQYIFIIFVIRVKGKSSGC